MDSFSDGKQIAPLVLILNTQIGGFFGRIADESMVLRREKVQWNGARESGKWEGLWAGWSREHKSNTYAGS